MPADKVGRQALAACALVATWWTGPSQRRLFSSVEISYDNYEKWMNGVVLSGSRTHLLEYVRSLRLIRVWDTGAKYGMQDLPQDSGGYLSALRDLHSLTLWCIKVEPLSEGDLRTRFSAFRETLTFLSLESLIISFSVFVTLVDYFPNITTLELRCLRVVPDEGPVQPLSRPLRGKVFVCVRLVLPEFFPEFLDRFAKLNLEYDSLVISGMVTNCLESALRISAGIVIFLKLPEFGRE